MAEHIYICDIAEHNPDEGVRAAQLIGPFPSFGALSDWADEHEDALSPCWQGVTVSNTVGQLPIYSPEQAEQVLPKYAAPAAAAQRAKDKQEEEDC